MSNLTPGTGEQSTRGLSRESKRTIFRVLGVTFMLTAVVLIGNAVADLVAAGNSMPEMPDPRDMTMYDDLGDEPTKFWMFFLALPFFALGGVFLNLGFSGVAASYMAEEYSPALRTASRSLGLDRRHEDRNAPGTGPYCRSCGTQNDADARFCDSCGSSMSV